MKDLNKEREAFEKLSQFKYLLEVCEWSEEQECYINESGDHDFDYFADACNGGLTAFLTQREDIERLKVELEKAKAQVVPEGYVLVPLEPTQEMLAAANRAPMPMVHIDSISGREKLRISTQYKAMVNVCKSGAEG